MPELQRPALLAAIDTFAEDEGFVVLALKNKDGTRFESALTYDVFGSVLRLLISSAVQLMSCNPRPGGIISSIRLPDQPIPAAGVRIIQGRSADEVHVHVDLGPTRLVFATGASSVRELSGSRSKNDAATWRQENDRPESMLTSGQNNPSTANRD